MEYEFWHVFAFLFVFQAQKIAFRNLDKIQTLTNRVRLRSTSDEFQVGLELRQSRFCFEGLWFGNGRILSLLCSPAGVMCEVEGMRISTTALIWKKGRMSSGVGAFSGGKAHVSQSLVYESVESGRGGRRVDWCSVCSDVTVPFSFFPTSGLLVSAKVLILSIFLFFFFNKKEFILWHLNTLEAHVVFVKLIVHISFRWPEISQSHTVWRERFQRCISDPGNWAPAPDVQLHSENIFTERRGLVISLGFWISLGNFSNFSKANFSESLLLAVHQSFPLTW